MAITAAQLEARKNSIGSSDVGAILGMDPFKDGLAVLGEKIGGLAPPEEAGEKASFGTRMEPVLRGWLEDEIGEKVVAPTSSFKHEQYDFLVSNLDAQIGKPGRGRPIAELKVSGLKDGWGEPGSDQVPDKVLAQVVFQMACSNAPLGYVVRCSAGFDWTPSLYVIPRRNDIIEALVEKMVKWWEAHVVRREPIDPSTVMLETATRILRNPGTLRRIDDPSVIDRFNEAREVRLAAEKDEEKAKAAVLATMGDADGLEVPGVGTFYYRQEGAGMGVDHELFRGQYPGLVAEYEEKAREFKMPKYRRVCRWKPVRGS